MRNEAAGTVGSRVERVVIASVICGFDWRAHDDA
jgi:hypothetical protein